MTLFNLVKKNVQGNFRNYLLYFYSLICGIVIYYTFVQFQHSPDLAVSTSETKSQLFKEVSILLILFVTLFIWYSNSFFTKKRKKEIGLYLLLGMRKKTVGKLLFYENLLLGNLALIVGIILGIVLSKLFTMVLLWLFGDSVADLSFNISLKPILNTVVVFTVIYFITSIQGYISIYRARLIHLFHAEKKGEHSPKTSLGVAGMAVIFIAFAYWIVLQPLHSSEQAIRNMGIFLSCLIIGTYLLFRYLTVYLLKFSQDNRSHYYKGTNSIVTSHLLYRIKGNVLTLTIIALLSAITLSVFSISYSQFYGQDEQVDQTAPFSYMFISKNSKFDNQIEQLLTEDKMHPITAQVNMPVIKVDADLSKLPISSPGDLKKDRIPVKIISVSSYNQANKALNREEFLQVSGNEAVAIKPKYTDHTPSNYKGVAAILKLPKQNYKVTYKNMTTAKVLNWSYPDIMMIVSDETFRSISKQVAPLIYKGYQVKNQQSAEVTSQQFQNLVPENEKMPTYYSVYRDSLEYTGLSMFVFGFLGLVFLAATGSIIYFKQLSEANEDIHRYKILRKIGLGRKEIRNLIAKQTLFVFAFPLLVGIGHSLFIIKAFSGLLATLAGFDLTIPILFSMIAYFVIYLGFYILTVKTYNNLVNSN